MAGEKTAVLAINAAALAANITIDVATALAPDGKGHKSAHAMDVWSGESLGTVTTISREVPPHGNIFVTLSNPTAVGGSSAAADAEGGALASSSV